MILNANIKTLSDRDLIELIWALKDRIKEVETEQQSREAARLAVEQMEWNTETAMFGPDGYPNEVPLAEALAKVASGEWYECAECNANSQSGHYDDGMRSFHPVENEDEAS